MRHFGVKGEKHARSCRSGDMVKTEVARGRRNDEYETSDGWSGPGGGFDRVEGERGIGRGFGVRGASLDGAWVGWRPMGARVEGAGARAASGSS